MASRSTSLLKIALGQIHVIHQGSDATGINRWAPPLPIYRGELLVRTGRLTLGQMLIMVTDGIGEALLDGSTEESIAFSSRITTRPTVFNIASFVSTIGPNDKRRQDPAVNLD